MSVLATSAQAGTIGMLIWIVVLLGFMYFFMVRPQKAEEKRKNAMLSEMAIGDTVLTSSGFYGTVIDIDNEMDTVIIEFGSNRNCRIPTQKRAIAAVEKPEEAIEAKDSKAKDSKAKDSKGKDSKVKLEKSKESK